MRLRMRSRGGKAGRVNAIRNSTAAGASAPSTMPTNWATSLTGTGLTREVIGSGNDGGLGYVDVKVSGTLSGSGNIGIYFETSTGIVALTGEAWTISAYWQLVAGSMTGVSNRQMVIDENTGAGAFVANGATVITAPTSSALATQRPTFTRTLTGGVTVQRIRPWILLTFTSNATLDFTIRFAAPQAERGFVATDPIRT